MSLEVKVLEGKQDKYLTIKQASCKSTEDQHFETSILVEPGQHLHIVVLSSEGKILAENTISFSPTKGAVLAKIKIDIHAGIAHLEFETENFALKVKANPIREGSYKPAHLDALEKLLQHEASKVAIDTPASA